MIFELPKAQKNTQKSTKSAPQRAEKSASKKQAMFYRFFHQKYPPRGPPKSPKIAKSRCRKVSFFRPYAFLALLGDFDSFWVLSGGEKAGFFMARAVKYAFSPKMSFGTPRIDFELILAAF